MPLSPLLHLDVAAYYNAVALKHSSFEANAADSGGAVAVYQGPSMQIQGCTFTGNTANNPYVGDTGGGGAIYTHEGARISISSSNFTNNTAGTGGAFYTQNESHLNTSDVQLVGNAATDDGGALAATEHSGGCCTMR